MDRNTLIKIRCYLILNPIKRTKYLIKKGVFNSVGKNFYFCPRKIPQDPMLIRFGDNVKVATDVFFVTHDIIHDMVNDIEPPFSDNKLSKEFGCIEVKNNVFIGAGSIILPNVTIGPDVIVAAGSVVTKSFSGGGNNWRQPCTGDWQC